jgi:hypothetical protein
MRLRHDVSKYLVSPVVKVTLVVMLTQLLVTRQV